MGEAPSGPSADGAADGPAGRHAEQELAGELRMWRVERIFGPLILVITVGSAVVAGTVPAGSLPAWWSWGMPVPAVVALLGAAVAIVALWRHRACRSTELDRIGATALDRIRAAVVAGTVRDSERGLAARILLNEGALFRVQGWTMLAVGSGQVVSAGSSASLVGVRIVLGIVALSLSALAFSVLARSFVRASKLVRPPREA